MSTAEISSSLEGDKLYQQRARESLPILVRQAKAGRKIFYADLANEIDIPNPRNLNYPLGSIGRALIELSEKWDEEIPQIQCIVVNQSTGLPGEGIEWFISDKKQFSKLNNKQKNALVDGLLAKIYAYDKWDSVLKALNLKPKPISENEVKKNKKIATSGFKGVGEGKEHKKLKEFISKNPVCLGLKNNGLQPEIEKYLPSGDSIDVFFVNRNNWIGVEVKSVISGELDILRGLYQCVKYLAVMDSYQAVLNENKQTRVILAIGGAFPESLIPIKNTLGIEVVDNIDS